jgi:hypothetical protein
MKIVPLEGTTMSVLELVELAQGEPVILTRAGHPLASIRGMTGSDWESASLVNNLRFVELIEQSRRSYREHGGIGIDQLRQELELESHQLGTTAVPLDEKLRADTGD